MDTQRGYSYSGPETLPSVESLSPFTPWIFEGRPPRIGVFIVTFHASATVTSVLNRIPAKTWQQLSEVFIFDDCSEDNTCLIASQHKSGHDLTKVRIFHNQINLGYGGNQKRGYRYAIENDFDIVVLLHGDGQYAPEVMDRLIEPLALGRAEAVLGSRMMMPGMAREGGMPLYKYVGNRILTWMQNRLLGKKLSEYHSGYRAYNMHALKRLPFLINSNDFHFDNEIIVQFFEAGRRLAEVPIPTYYGGEICRVNGIKYAWNVLRTNVRYRLHKAGLVYARQFDLRRGHKYTFKHNAFSSHSRIIELAGNVSSQNESRVLDVGCGGGFLAAKLAQAGHSVVGVDVYDNIEAQANCERFLVADIERSLGVEQHEKLDLLVFADVLEHLREPEQVLLRARRHLNPKGRIIASTGNVAHLFIRLSLLLGFFTYTERGILDRTHTRLFTLRNFRRLFRDCGLRVTRAKYCPIPFENIFVGRPWLSGLLCFLNMWAVWIWPSLFAYQVVLEAEVDAVPSELMRAQEILRPEFTEWETNRELSAA